VEVLATAGVVGVADIGRDGLLDGRVELKVRPAGTVGVENRAIKRDARAGVGDPASVDEVGVDGVAPIQRSIVWTNRFTRLLLSVSS